MTEKDGYTKEIVNINIYKDNVLSGDIILKKEYKDIDESKKLKNNGVGRFAITRVVEKYSYKLNKPLGDNNYKDEVSSIDRSFEIQQKDNSNSVSDNSLLENTAIDPSLIEDCFNQNTEIQDKIDPLSSIQNVGDILSLSNQNNTQ